MIQGRSSARVDECGGGGEARSRPRTATDRAAGEFLGFKIVGKKTSTSGNAGATIRRKRSLASLTQSSEVVRPAVRARASERTGKRGTTVGPESLERVEEQRLAEAKVTEIAFKWGFENLANFNRRFLAIKGPTPSAFRARFPRASS
jgi:AraC-like DNA-binding protein